LLELQQASDKMRRIHAGVAREKYEAPTETSSSITAIGCNHWKLIAEPTPTALIRAAQQSGHLGIAAVNAIGTAESPILRD